MERTNDFDNMKVEVPKGVDGLTGDMLERCVVACGRAAGTKAKMRYKSWIDNEVSYTIDLVFDEEKMQPEKLTKASENAGIDLSSMRVSKWYQESTREDGFFYWNE